MLETSPPRKTQNRGNFACSKRIRCCWFAGFAVVGYVTAMLVGIVIDVVVRHINLPIQSDLPREMIAVNHLNRRAEDSPSFATGACRLGQDNSEQAISRCRSSTIETQSGDWGKRALSITDDASSIGFPMYQDVEDGCVQLNPKLLQHMDLSDPNVLPS